MARQDIFGNQVDDFKSALEWYGVWPTTVWPVDHSDLATRKLKELIGDIGTTRLLAGSTPAAKRTVTTYRGSFRGDADNVAAWQKQTRAGSFMKPVDDESVYRGKVTASIFNPSIAAWLLNCFAPAEGLCFDPFAGGGTRAIMATKRGLRYVGVELREEEVEVVRARVERAGVSDAVTIVQGDARECPGIPEASADFLMTCPPYWTLEQYEGGDADLSMIPDYPSFVAELGKVVRRTAEVLKPGATSCWVVGLHRDPAGVLVAMNHDVARLHAEAGFDFREEIVLSMKNNGSIQRVGNFDKGSHRLIRQHEYCLVFTRR